MFLVWKHSSVNIPLDRKCVNYCNKCCVFAVLSLCILKWSSFIVVVIFLVWSLIPSKNLKRVAIPSQWTNQNTLLCWKHSGCVKPSPQIVTLLWVDGWSALSPSCFSFGLLMNWKATWQLAPLLPWPPICIVPFYSEPNLIRNTSNICFNYPHTPFYPSDFIMYSIIKCNFLINYCSFAAN